MNSVVQLLSHVKELRAYFTVGSWQEDLNLTSFLGYGGRVATGWHNIVSQLWNGSTTVHAPHGFKRVIDALGLGFDGTNMHDAAELLNIVIGALDEDTNKITNKTYVKNKDIDENQYFYFWLLTIQTTYRCYISLFKTPATCIECIQDIFKSNTVLFHG